MSYRNLKRSIGTNAQGKTKSERVTKIPILFHVITIKSGQRNIIVRIQDSAGRWVDDEQPIRYMIFSFPHNLFQSERPSGIEAVIQYIPSLMIAELNERLCPEVDDKEIKQAAFSLCNLNLQDLTVSVEFSFINTGT